MTGDGGLAAARGRPCADFAPAAHGGRSQTAKVASTPVPSEGRIAGLRPVRVAASIAASGCEGLGLASDSSTKMTT